MGGFTYDLLQGSPTFSCGNSASKWLLWIAHQDNLLGIFGLKNANHLLVKIHGSSFTKLKKVWKRSSNSWHFACMRFFCFSFSLWPNCDRALQVWALEILWKDLTRIILLSFKLRTLWCRAKSNWQGRLCYFNSTSRNLNNSQCWQLYSHKLPSPSLVWRGFLENRPQLLVVCWVTNNRRNFRPSNQGAKVIGQSASGSGACPAW